MQERVIVGGSLVFICDTQCSVQRDYAVLIENDRILEVAPFAQLQSAFPNISAHFHKDCVLLPALINAHIHFEFSNNVASFVYGDFGRWLDSVIAKRDDVLGDITQSIHQALAQQLKSGVGSVGAISSYGYDLEPLAHSPLRVVYFNEAMGSNPSALDSLFANLKARVEDCKAYQSRTFTPAIALHSPYSLHTIYAKHALELARQLKAPVSAHFLESTHEREWLDCKSGYFYDFFTKAFGVSNPTPFFSAQSFLAQFNEINALFTHCLFASRDELNQMAQNNHSVVICPRSNRLLCNTYFALHNAPKSLNIAIGTDGKSSNNSVDMLEELKSALFGYVGVDIQWLAQKLLLSATNGGGKALGIESGELKKDKNADIAVFAMPQVAQIDDVSQAALHFILQAKEAKSLYIAGREVLCDIH